MLGTWILLITGILMLLKLPVESILFVVILFSLGVDVFSIFKK